MAGLTQQWSEAESNAALGMPSGGVIKRLVAKLIWPFLQHQVTVNRALLAELDAVARRINDVAYEMDRARGDIEHHTEVLVRHEEPLDRHEFLLEHLEPAIGDMVRQFELVQDKIDLGQRQALARYHEGLGPLRTEFSEMHQRLDEIERFTVNAEASVERATSLAQSAGTRVDQIENALDEQRASEAGEPWRRALEDVWLRMGQLDLFLTEARRSFPAPIPAERLNELPTGFDGLHRVFEEAFRGPYAVVRARVSAYVSDLDPGTGPVLDLGCGRGELLDVLAAAGIDAYGIDLSAEQVARCRERGLDARREDARQHLAALPERSLGAVTAIQFVEHLATDELIELIELAARAVRPGGRLIFETQNPENVVVGASTFYLDPSHRRPLPPALLAFLVSARGFSEVEIRRLDRSEQAAGLSRPKPDEPWAEVVGSLVDAVNFHLFSPADYAVIARRP